MTTNQAPKGTVLTRIRQFAEELNSKAVADGFAGDEIGFKILDILDAQPASAPFQTDDAKRFKHACWLNMQHAIHRYLMSNAEGRWDGAEKATRHIELCKFMVAVLRNGDPETIRREFESEYQAVHEKTQELTSYLDEQIGFPISGRPDYEKLAPLFFENFFDLAIAAIQAQGAKQT